MPLQVYKEKMTNSGSLTLRPQSKAQCKNQRVSVITIKKKQTLLLKIKHTNLVTQIAELKREFNS